jgi:hypothetical protein
MQMMPAEPQMEHKWLQQLVGDWTIESNCSMGPDAPPMNSTGTCRSQMLGELWLLGDWQHDTSDGPSGKSLITIGYDPARKRFTGSFVSGMMTHLWIYDGELDAKINKLTLNAEGPSFAGDGSMSKYQDIIEITGPNEHKLHSQMLGPDGKWTPFMTATFRRKS